jgi:hypothetical protein
VQLDKLREKTVLFLFFWVRIEGIFICPKDGGKGAELIEHFNQASDIGFIGTLRYPTETPFPALSYFQSVKEKISHIP